MAATNELSDRELEILKLVATGASNKEVASQLYISPNTVKVHLKNIFSKIGVASRTEAAMYAVNSGLVEGVATLNNTVINEKGTLTQANSGRKSWRIIFGLFVIGSIIALIYFWGLSNRNTESAETVIAEESRWEVLTNMPTGRYGHSTVVFDNNIYTIGGKSINGVSEAVESYDPDSDSWTSHKGEPTPVFDVGAVIIGGRIFVPGGRISDSEVTNILQIYNPETDEWVTGANLATPSCCHGIIAFEGKLYLFGGWDGKDYLDSIVIYDPETDSWKLISDLPIKVAYPGVIGIAERMHILGGYDGKRSYDSHYIYDPNKKSGDDDEWIEDSPLPYGVYGAGTINFLDTIYIIGGRSDRKDQNSFLQYISQNNTWQVNQETNHQLRAYSGTAISGPNIYITGGLSGENISDNNLSYQGIYLVNIPLIR